MFKFLKKKRPSCKHADLKKIVEFKEKIDNFYIFKIYECQSCGKRFWCSFDHMLHHSITEEIDNFINRSLSLTPFIGMLTREKFEYIIHEDFMNSYLKINDTKLQ